MKKIIASILITLIIIGFSFFKPSEDKVETTTQVAEQGEAKASTPLSDNKEEETAPSLTQVTEEVEAAVAATKKVEPLQVQQENYQLTG